MGNLPQIGRPATIPIRLSTPGHLMDHHFKGQPVLPAVAAMEVLARTVKELHPHLKVDHLTQIRFDKFLPLDPSQTHLEAVVELQPSGNDECQAVLATRTRAPKAAITRTKLHARVSFTQGRPAPDPWPPDVAAAPEGICQSIPPEKLYAELVPFGPSFQNIESPVYISPDGALTRIKTPEMVWAGYDNCLGSPFALDAAMHGACVWAQHFRGVVAFPVAIDSRYIIRPALPGRVYYGRVRPQIISDDLMVFDIGVLDAQGSLCEMARGVHMRDVSGGHLQPPPWIIRKDGPDPFKELKKNCRNLTVVELDAALKRLYRQCRGGDSTTPADLIETVDEKSPLPRCTRTDSAADLDDLHCSASHDRRLAVAVAHAGPVGIDVEEISGRALRCGRIYMHADELRLVRHSDLGARGAALRIWSIKEGAAKALGLNLATAWQSVRVTRIGGRQSRFVVHGRAMTAQHGRVDAHLVSLIVGA